MQNKKRLRKKFYSIRAKKYFDINPNFFNPLSKLLKKNFLNKNIKLSIYYPACYEINVLKLFEVKFKSKLRILLPIVKKKTA